MLKVLEIALAEVGYLEKKSNSNLDDKTANAGSANYTKYARDLDALGNFYDGKKNGYAWCDVFVDWCFVKAYGVEKAKKLLCQPNKSYGAGCTASANYYKAAKRFYTSGPRVGDQIFFKSGATVVHTGLVYKVTASAVYTVEGNTSGASGVIANGGGVCKKSYALNYGGIYGYGRPDYSLVGESVEASPTAEKRATTTVKVGVLKKGLKGNDVKAVQALLINKFKISCGAAGMDGDFGAGTDKAVRDFQKKKGLTVDGIVGADTWTALIEG